MVDWGKMGVIGEANVHHYTIGRCGSSLISQILFYIFGFENVWAGHDEIPKIEGPVVITYRDFRDVVVSYWRVIRDIKPEELDAGKKMSTDDVLEFVNSTSGLVKAMDRVLERNSHALLFRYEEFFSDNWNLILTEIQKYFKISLTAKQIEEIKIKYSLAANKKRSDNLVSFKEIGNDYLHGNHIYKGKIGGWKDLVNPNDYHILQEKLTPHLLKWRYTI